MTLAVEGKSALVTGGNSGIGYEIARALSRAGASVILTSRSAARAKKAAATIADETGNAVTGRQLDFSGFANINAFADDLVAGGERLDILVNNAGALFTTRKQSADGFEMTWAVNHLGPFLLTARLMPLLKQASGARIVTTSSSAHHSGTIAYDGLGLSQSYSRSGAYGRSKLGNVLFTAALARRLKGLELTATCFHPGVVATGFFRFIPVIGPLARVLATPFLRSPQKGAETGIYLAGDADAQGASGGYYFDRQLARTSRIAADEAVQQKVWEISAEQTGASWDFS